MESSKEYLQNLKNLFDNTKNRKNWMVLLLVSIIAVILYSILAFVSKKLNLNKSNCNNIKKTYTEFPLITSVNPSDIKDDYGLRDFYVKSAYNCCASGKFKNDWVNTCALSNCIKQGARFLDFEIYSVKDEPVIGISTMNSYSYKESYNFVKFSDVCETIKDEAFNNAFCPNSFDPLILHFRIKTKNKKIYKQMTNIIYDTISNRLLDKQFSYENFTNKLANGTYMPFKNLFGKIIIIVDKSNNSFENTELDEYINITSNSNYCRLYRYNEIKYIYDSDELKKYNKKNMSIILPDLGINNNNHSIILANEYGCQFHCMNIQNFDSYMSFNTSYFDDYNSAFVLKPEELRETKINIPNKDAETIDTSITPEDVYYNPDTDLIMTRLITEYIRNKAIEEDDLVI